MQIPDAFIYKKEKYDFLEAENIYSLFNPIEYGFRPVMMRTACYKGFVIAFRIDDEDNLVLDSLLVNDTNHHYEDINGVKAEITELEYGKY